MLYFICQIGFTQSFSQHIIGIVNLMGCEMKAKKKKKVNVLTVIAVVLTIAVAGMGAYILHLRNEEAAKETLRLELISTGVFNKGVSVSGIDISNMTVEQAKTALEPVEAKLASVAHFTVKLKNSTYEIGKDNFIFTYNTQEVLNEAIMLAREGELEQIEAEIADIAANGRTYEIKCDIQLGDCSPLLELIAQEAYIAPVNASFSMKQLEPNPETNTNNAINIGYPNESTASDAPKTTIDVRDLRFDFVEQIQGVTIDKDALIETLKTRTAQRDFGTVELDTIALDADITIATIKQNLVLRSEARTFYGKTPYNRDTRVHNLKKAAGLIYGTVLQPNDVFSANGILGNRTEEGGWQLAPAVIEGGAKSEDQPGGGVCQVSSTIYNAVIKGDFEVVFRQAHSSKLSYVDGGCDATIDSGRIDFKWKNNTSAPLYVFTWIDTKEKYVRCEIYGQPFGDEFDSIEIVSEELEPLPTTSPEYIESSSLVPPYWMLNNKAKKGYVFQTYAIYYKDGVEVNKKEVALTTYKMHPARYLVWPGYVQGTVLQDAYKLEPSPTPMPVTTPMP